MLGVSFALLATCLYATKGIFVKIMYSLGVDTVSVMALRAVISFPIYFLITIWLYYKLDHYQHQSLHLVFVKCLTIGFFGYYLATYFDLYSLNYISAQLSGLVSFAYPTFVIVLNRVFFKIPLSKAMLLTLTLTYGGIFTLFHHELKLEGDNVAFGVMLGLLGAGCFAGYMLFSKPIVSMISSGLFTSLAMSAASLCILIHFILSNRWNSLALTPNIIILSFCMAIGCTIIPSYLVGASIKRIGANKTAVLGGVGPGMTAAMAILILDEPYSSAHFIGMLLVILAIMIQPCYVYFNKRFNR